MRLPLLALVVALGLVIACEDIPAAKPSCFGVANACGIHATCDVVTSSCLCEAGYAGSTCTKCAPGFQDKNGNGSCQPACTGSGSECGPRARCTDQSGAPVCTCITGYGRGYARTELQAGGAGLCDDFVGGPLDPDFTAEPPNVWNTSGDVTIELNRALFHGAGEIFQSFEMPSFQDAEPLAAVIGLSCRRTDDGKGCQNVGGAFRLAFDDAERTIPIADGVPQVRSCLGDRAFGRTVRFGIRTSDGPAGIEKRPADDLVLGEVKFSKEEDCPAPGSVYDGDFSLGLWPGSTGTVEQLDTKAGARLLTGCPRELNEVPASISTSVSIPTALDSPALLLSITGSPQGKAEVSLDGEVIGTITIGVSPSTKPRPVVCLPPSARGFAPSLTIKALPNEPSCNILVVDEVVLASDGSCATSP